MWYFFFFLNNVHLLRENPLIQKWDLNLFINIFLKILDVISNYFIIIIKITGIILDS